jgi:hypothetical protein
MKVKTRFYKKNLVFVETVMLEIFFSDHLMNALDCRTDFTSWIAQEDLHDDRG